MEALFASPAGVSADDVRARLTDAPSYSAVRKAALQQLVHVFFGGSPGETATALLKQERWTDEELDALRQEIDAVRRGRNRS